jgi:CRISPR-associated endonuclease/helicase Cas3
MSATVPRHLEELLREALDAPSVPKEIPWGEKVRHRLSLSPFDSQSDAALRAILSAAELGSVLVVVNQVSRAIWLWNRLRSKASNATHLLHSRFHVLDRSKKESDLAPAPGMILVATQAVEVSLDLDFDRCFTEIAPIAQRFGRCNRPGCQGEPAPVSVFLQFPEGGSPCAPYEEAHIKRVRGALEEFFHGEYVI